MSLQIDAVRVMLDDAKMFIVSCQKLSNFSTYIEVNYLSDSPVYTLEFLDHLRFEVKKDRK